MSQTQLRRAFVVAWLTLAVLGALNHTIAQDLFGRRFDLILPHLKYGHVMFNKNLRTVQVYQWSEADSDARHDLADLVETPAYGYENARVGIDVLTKPDYLMEICFRATTERNEPLTFYVSEYQVDVDPRTPARTATLRCDRHGLSPR